MARAGETNWPSNCLFHYTDRISLEAIAEDGYFIEVDRRVFLLPAEDGMGELIHLQGVLIATGIRVRGRWELLPWN
jgi:hypothetical protein